MKALTLKTLIVEDNFPSRVLLQSLLSRYGECHAAVNGREAVEAFRLALDSGVPYGLICMDILMPEMDGKEAVRQVRAAEKERGILSTDCVKIIMTTGAEDIKEVIQSFQALCDAYLLKPIDPVELLRNLKSLGLQR
jgi:two-component system chemotaxis response regulator CheY